MLETQIGINLAKEVTKTPLPVNEMDDEICLGLTGNGIFSTKSTTWLAHGLETNLEDGNPFGWIWKPVLSKARLRHARGMRRQPERIQGVRRCGFPDAM